MQGLPQIDLTQVPAAPARALPARLGLPARARLLGRLSPGRDEAERFIADRYLRDYGAVLTHFLPTLVALPSSGGSLLSAAGIAPAAGGALFLERYLDAPVEQVISRTLGLEVSRPAVLEVGNLAAGTAGGGRLMILTLARLLEGRGFEWITFTATRALRNSLARLGIPAHELVVARRSALGGDGAAWGRYYEHDPRVVACSLHAAWTLLYGAGGAA
jgi:hypothetical protein